MNDEMKGKSGKVKVMMILINVPTTRVPGKGAGVQENLVLTVAVAPPAMTNRVSPVTASGKIRRGARFPARRVMRRRKRPITVASVVKVLLIQKFCVVSVRKKPASTAKMHVRHCSKAYHVVDEAELTKASGTEHHGGVCFLIKKRNGTTVQQWVSQAGAQDCVLALENESNPHNLGGMMRSCAHFGVKGVVVQDAALLESGAAIRTAEGGAEHVQPITGDNIVNVLDDFRQAGYTVVTTSSEQGKPLFKTSLPAKMVLVLGQEYEGLPDAARDPNDLRVKIDGTGNVAGLNISVATGVLLGEWWRQNKA